jgi:uncharacterized membrane protein (DUF4010 family)
MDAVATGVLRIAVAALGGAAIGIERQWSGHAEGPGGRLGGLRTFTLLGGLAGIAGWLWTVGASGPAVVLLAGSAGLVLATFAAASRHDVYGTTEVAALVALAAGVLSGLGFMPLASGIVALTCLLLVEKTRVHQAVSRLDDAEIRAGVRFAVMAAVILPLLPEGPYGPLGGVRPRQLWMLVLFFSGLSFVGFIGRRAVGAKRGYAIAGLLGGLVSSTSVTFTFSRESRSRPELAHTLAIGVLAACAVLPLRVLLGVAVLNRDLLPVLALLLAAPFLAGILTALVGWRRVRPEEGGDAGPPNPLELRNALQMAAAFQVVLFAVHLARAQWGNAGLVVSGAVFGLTDLDALTISMARAAATDATLVLPAAQAIAMGILSNTLFKIGLAVALGRAAVRVLVPIGLAVVAVASILSLVVVR